MYSKIDKFLLLFTDCKIVDGYVNSAIFDFSRQENSNLIPKSYSDFIEKCKVSSISDIFKTLKNKDEKVIVNDYIQFTIENEFGFMCNKEIKNNFTDLLKNPNSPEYIDNCILELSGFDIQKMKKIVEIFEVLMLSSLEIRITTIKLNELSEFLNLFSVSIINSIQIHIEKIEDSFNMKKILDIKNTNKRIKRISIYDNKILIENSENNIYFETISLENTLNKPTIITKIINISHYLESLSKNTYFNKKIFIDKQGNIKSAPELNAFSYNIEDIKKPNDVFKILDENFKYYWNISKNKIHVCKDCEFRNVCFDNRIPNKSVDNMFYLEEECSYNPYIGKYRDYFILRC